MFAGYMAAALGAARPVVFTECDDGARARTTPRVLAVLTVHHHLSRVEAALVSLCGCWEEPLAFGDTRIQGLLRQEWSFFLNEQLQKMQIAILFHVIWMGPYE